MCKACIWEGWILNELHWSKRTHSQGTAGLRVHFQICNAWLSLAPSRSLSRLISSLVTPLDRGTWVRTAQHKTQGTESPAEISEELLF